MDWRTGMNELIASSHMLGYFDCSLDRLREAGAHKLVIEAYTDKQIEYANKIRELTQALTDYISEVVEQPGEGSTGKTRGTGGIK